MNNHKKDNDSTFINFVKLERELKDKELLHAKASILYMSNCLKEEIVKETIYDKIKNYFYELKEAKYLKKLKNKYEKKASYYNLTQKSNKQLKQQNLKKGDYVIHVFMEQLFGNKNVIGEFSGTSFPCLTYKIYLKIEYHQIITKEHLVKEFENINDATNYYNKILSCSKSKSASTIINNLSKLINNHIQELDDRIKQIVNIEK